MGYHLVADHPLAFLRHFVVAFAFTESELRLAFTVSFHLVRLGMLA
jgi:hypothetical protein